MKQVVRHRGQTRRDLQQVRDRLMSQIGEAPAYDYELVFLYTRNQINTGPAVLMFAVAIASLCAIWTHWIWAFAWLSGILFAQGWTHRLSRRFQEADSDTVNLRQYISLITTTEFFNASMWASLGILSWQTDIQMFDVYVFVTLLIGMCVRSIQASPIIAAVYTTSLPITFVLIFSFVGSDSVQPTPMIAIAVCAQIFFVLIARRINETTLAMLHYRAEKDILISKLEEEKSKSDEGRRRAEDANIAKSQFLATMSHELRTPLNAILGFSEVMKEEIYGPHSTPQYSAYADDIHRSGRHLLDLINEILDLSRIEAGRYEITEESVALDHALDDCCYLMLLRCKEKNIELTEVFDDNMPRIWADDRAVHQMGLNLLSNAVKFTPNGGAITLRCGMNENHQPFFAVTDNGPGIPEDEIEKIMTSFGQGSLAQKTAEDGAGLGLPIVKGLVHLHDGTIEIHSQLRVGTTATVTFPRSRLITTWRMDDDAYAA